MYPAGLPISTDVGVSFDVSGFCWLQLKVPASNAVVPIPAPRNGRLFMVFSYGLKFAADVEFVETQNFASLLTAIKILAL